MAVALFYLNLYHHDSRLLTLVFCVFGTWMYSTWPPQCACISAPDRHNAATLQQLSILLLLLLINIISARCLVPSAVPPPPCGVWFTTIGATGTRSCRYTLHEAYKLIRFHSVHSSRDGRLLGLVAETMDGTLLAWICYGIMVWLKEPRPHLDHTWPAGNELPLGLVWVAERVHILAPLLFYLPFFFSLA